MDKQRFIIWGALLSIVMTIAGITSCVRLITGTILETFSMFREG